MLSQELGRLGVFATVAVEGSLSKAAEKLGSSRSAVSKQIAGLEQALNLRLLHRSARLTRLTDEGEALYPKCVEILNNFYSTQELAEQLRGIPSGKLTLDMSSGLFTKYLVLKRINDFKKQYPKIDLQLRLRSVSIQELSDDLEIAIIAGELEDSSLICRRLHDAQVMPFASRQYLEEYGMPDNPDDLSKHQCIAKVNNTIMNDQWMFSNKDETRNITIAPSIVVDDGDTAKRLTLEGVGIAMLMIHAVSEEVASGLLTPVLTDYCCPSVPIYIVYPERKHLSPKIRAMVDFLFRCVEQECLENLTENPLTQ